MMNETDAQQLNDACTRFDAGERSQALDELLDLAARTKDPWDKAEVLYNEAMFLVEMGRIPEAR